MSGNRYTGLPELSSCFLASAHKQDFYFYISCVLDSHVMLSLSFCLVIKIGKM